MTDYLPVIGAIAVIIYTIVWYIKNYHHIVNKPTEINNLQDNYWALYAIKKSMRRYRHSGMMFNTHHKSWRMHKFF